VLEVVPADARRILDLGSGDGRLLALLRVDRPGGRCAALDASPAMLDAARARFAGEPGVAVRRHDLAEPLPAGLGPFDAVVSAFAVHHLEHARKRALYREAHDLLAPGGVFANLEHVASPTDALHVRFLAELGLRPDEEDASNRLLDVETQLGWLREIGFADVDCLWKWREMALLTGVRPLTA
jgi:SAM-dependent methyltransferase